MYLSEQKGRAYLLDQAEPDQSPRLYIGCSGWSYKEWKGAFYPTDLPSKEYFSYYTQFFNTVEINSTFYHFPTLKTVRSWYEKSPPNFKYSLKASRYITHIKKFKNIQEPLKKFYGLTDILAEKTGYFLFQFPESYVYSEENMAFLLPHFDGKYKNVVEFRHPSWQDFHIMKTFESAGILLCSVSGFKLSRNLNITYKKAYIRFHGDPPYSSLYSKQELSQWAYNIHVSSLQEVWAYFNNTVQGYAAQNALQFKKILKDRALHS